jgi:uncharacterized protein
MGNRAGSNPVIPTNMEAIYIPITILMIIIALVFGAIFFLVKIMFNRRFDPHPKLKYFTIQDFPGADMDEVSFPSRLGHQLKGGFYYDDRVPGLRKLIIFAHGVGAGHEAYTHLIMHFVQKGYVVFAFDYTGCARSEGKAVRGIPQASADLHDALAYLSNTTYAQYPWILLGHSWGAYNVLTVKGYEQKLSSIVSITPFNDVVAMLAVYLPWIRVFKWFVTIAIALSFGWSAAQTTSQRLRRTTTKTLVIVGEKDEEIPLKGNYDRFLEAQKHNPKVQVFLAKQRRHNPYLSVRGETQVIDTILKGMQRITKEKDAAKIEAFFQQLDYTYVGEHDPTIMAIIDSFIA